MESKITESQYLLAKKVISNFEKQHKAIMSKDLKKKLVQAENQKLIDFAEWIIDNCYNVDLNKEMTNKHGVGFNCFFGHGKRGEITCLTSEEIVKSYLKDTK